MRKNHILIFFLISVILASCRGGGEATYRKVSGAVWGTTFNITYKANRSLDDSIQAVMSTVDNSLSAFNKTSLLSKINRCESNKIDTLFRHVFNVSTRVNRLSDGMFDPTVAPLVNIWGFGYTEDTAHAPTNEQIDSLLPIIGIADCRINNDIIIKKNQATQFNFSAIAKGYGCDLIAETLQRNGCNDFMIEIGGEVVISGKNTSGKAWRIMIDAPISNDSIVTHQQYAIIEPGDCGIATSGNYRNFRTIDGKRVGHTINPKTGYPVETTVASVTVIAPTAIEADAFATACMAMPTAQAIKMIEAQADVSALFIISTNEDKWFTITTSRFPPIKEQ